MLKKNKHYARYMFLKSRHEAGETIIYYATRLREKAYACDFGNSNEGRILQRRIQTFEHQNLIGKWIYKGWTLDQYLIYIKNISVQVNDMQLESAVTKKR